MTNLGDKLSFMAERERVAVDRDRLGRELERIALLFKVGKQLPLAMVAEILRLKAEASSWGARVRLLAYACEIYISRHFISLRPHAHFDERSLRWCGNAAFALLPRRVTAAAAAGAAGL